MREPNLLSYLPAYLQEYWELREIMLAENPELQVLWQGVESVQENLYILTADEYGLRRFEQLLRIKPAPGDNLESRRAHVLVRWNNGTPYTLRYLLAQLDQLCGEGNHTLYPDWDNYRFRLEVYLPGYGAVADLVYLLETVVPCNLEWQAHNSLPVKPDVDLLLEGAMCCNVIYTDEIQYERRVEAVFTGWMDGALCSNTLYGDEIQYDRHIAGALSGYAGGAASTVTVYRADIDPDHYVEAALESSLGGAVSSMTAYHDMILGKDE